MPLAHHVLYVIALFFAVVKNCRVLGFLRMKLSSVPSDVIGSPESFASTSLRTRSNIALE